jgi:type II secretion system protein H
MRAPRAGFTLIEIIVVLAIMAVVSAAVLPALRGAGPEGAVVAPAGDIAQVLRAARRAALEGALPITVSIVPAAGTYVVETETGDAPAILAQGALALPPGVHLAGDRPRLRFVFGRLGLADPDSVALVGEDGSAVVAVDRWTGEISVRVAGT